jgi:hypothetical protein
MKIVFTLPLLTALLSGCVINSTTKRHDAVEGVMVDQMVGNQVGTRFLSKNVLCLNARREIKAATGQREHFLYTELISVTGFTPQAGESLVLNVDGERFGFTPTNSSSAFVSRRGYEATLYRASAEVLVKIANAKEVTMRLKGNNQVIERRLSSWNRGEFRDYLAKYYQDPTPEIVKPAPAPKFKYNTRDSQKR